jgi:hypothetical protein
MIGDNAKLRRVDKAMGWVEPDGSSPAATAERLGVASHIIGDVHGLPVVVWQSDGVFSYCVLNRYRFCTTTLLARSKPALIRLLGRLYQRVNSESEAKRWQPYYSAMWERRYRRWCCKRPAPCDCQLCRIAGHAVRP